MVIMSCQEDTLTDSLTDQDHSHDSTDYTKNVETRNSEYSVSGRVWEDIDGDGIQDRNEPAFKDFTLCLKRKEDKVTVQEYVTDDTGQYFFDIEEEGEYFIEVKQSRFTQDYIATFELKNSEASNSDIFEAFNSDITHEFGQNTSESFAHNYNGVLDFGFYKGGYIGNQAWIDRWSDGGGMPYIYLSLIHI